MDCGTRRRKRVTRVVTCEMLDEQLLVNCDTKSLDCIAKVGANLGVEKLLYGDLDAGTVTLHLVDVHAKKHLGSWSHNVDVDKEAVVAKLAIETLLR